MLEDYKLDSISNELNIFLAASARKNAFIPKPLVLKAQFKNIPAVSDHENRVYEINMNELASFRDVFTDKQCKYVRLHEWEFNLKFKNKTCVSIELNAQHIALITSKSNKREIRDCNFSLSIANEEGVKNLSGSNLGFLNRLGKRNLVTTSEYVAEEHFALINFIRKPLNFNAVEKIGISSAKLQVEEDPLTYLNPRGKELLEKLRHFITKEHLLNFVVEQELSQEGENRMRKIILSGSLGQSKKKNTYTRNIIESLQKSLQQ